MRRTENRKRRYLRPKFTQYLTPMQLKNTIWEIHQYDDDGFPSVPHGHSLENGRHKLDVFTGKIYDITTKEIVGEVREKELKKLHNEKRFRKVVEEARRYYLDKNPSKTLPIPRFMSYHSHIKSREYSRYLTFRNISRKSRVCVFLLPATISDNDLKD